MKKAVILLSGGLDSYTCLALAKAAGFQCHALSINYGQRHPFELTAAQKISEILGVKEHRIITLDYNQLGSSALLDKNIKVPDYSDAQQIPITYVPARNTVFLALSLGYAEVIGAFDIYIGVNAVDYSGYPDCRSAFINAFETLANVATRASTEGAHFKIQAPLLHLSKSEIIQKGITLGLDYSLTVSCYQLDEKGAACGQCDSCFLRKQGFEKANVVDPTHYR